MSNSLRARKYLIKKKNILNTCVCASQRRQYQSPALPVCGFPAAQERRDCAEHAVRGTRWRGALMALGDARRAFVISFANGVRLRILETTSRPRLPDLEHYFREYAAGRVTKNSHYALDWLPPPGARCVLRSP